MSETIKKHGRVADFVRTKICPRMVELRADELAQLMESRVFPWLEDAVVLVRDPELDKLVKVEWSDLMGKEATVRLRLREEAGGESENSPNIPKLEFVLLPRKYEGQELDEWEMVRVQMVEAETAEKKGENLPRPGGDGDEADLFLEVAAISSEDTQLDKVNRVLVNLHHMMVCADNEPDSQFNESDGAACRVLASGKCPFRKRDEG